ncbi:DUF1993 domain-containing protein [Massilia sp. YIM B02763]|uniref:DUF1993 domain-containing protein n=1 Tax=Massilia sp. YIM B02763 TaxID=3050130 RepID=UPI0025B6BF7B|nr:DUF1993 domain-containing protein [Massilia sp. YIM B02763]MDN4053557.1 DUF1993 domain-containing protein [Massilia sp. YIM B02763]
MIAPTRLFLHYLDRLHELLQRVAAFDADVAGRRLHPDMAPLLQQARTAIGFTLRASCPLAGREIVSFAEGELTLPAVLSELAATVRYLAEIPDADFDRIDALNVHTTAGFAELDLSGWDYYLMYAVPNFFFHYSMVYAIARQAGVPVGKADFDGYHRYPPGFSFARQAGEAGKDGS